MKIENETLPPTWVKVFSYLFLIYLVVPVFAIWQLREAGSTLGVSAFGIDLKGNKDPIQWILAIDLILFLGGLTGLFIIKRRRFAYGLGIAYCIVTLLVTPTAHLTVSGGNPGRWIGAAIQYPMLILFLIHLVRHRRDWIKQSGGSRPVE